MGRVTCYDSGFVASFMWGNVGGISAMWGTCADIKSGDCVKPIRAHSVDRNLLGDRNQERETEQ